MDSSDEEMDGDDGQWRSQFTGPEEPATSGKLWSFKLARVGARGCHELQLCLRFQDGA